MSKLPLVFLALALCSCASGRHGGVVPVPDPVVIPPSPVPNPGVPDSWCKPLDFVLLKFPGTKGYLSGGRCFNYVGQGDPSKLPPLWAQAEAKVQAKAGKLPDSDPLLNVVWYFKPTELVFPDGAHRFAINGLVSEAELVSGELAAVCKYYPASCVEGKVYVSSYTNLDDPYPIVSYITDETPAVAHEGVHILWFYMRPGVYCPEECKTTPQYQVVEHGYCCDPFK